MNELLLLSQIRGAIKEVKERNIPTIVATVQSVNGHIVWLNSNTGVAGLYSCGVCKVTSGELKDVVFTIVESAGQSITLFGSIGGALKLNPGDTVELSSGELGNADIYLLDPPTVEATDNKGKRFSITINVTANKLAVKSLGVGGRDRNIMAYKREYSVQLLVEAPKGIGISSETTLRALYGIHTITEQVMCLVGIFRMNTANRVFEASDITCVYGQTQRTGQDNVTKAAAAIEFEVAVI